MRLWYLSHMQLVKAQASLRSEGSGEPAQWVLTHWMAAHACLKNPVLGDEKCHNLISWLICYYYVIMDKHCRLI